MVRRARAGRTGRSGRSLLALLALGAFALAVGLPILRSPWSARIVPGERRSAPRVLVVRERVAGDPRATDALVAFARRTAIDAVLVGCEPLGRGEDGARAAYAALVERLHAAELAVFALAGEAGWTVPAELAPPVPGLGHAAGWEFWANVARSGVPFDGVCDDSTPAETDASWALPRSLEERAQHYLDWLAGVRAATPGLELWAAIPCWYDEDPAWSLALDGRIDARALHWYVAEIADVLVVRTERDEARGADGIVARVEAEIAAGRTVLAVTTRKLGDDATSDRRSFHEEGARALNTELAELGRRFRQAPGFAGVVIDDWAGYRELRP